MLFNSPYFFKGISIYGDVRRYTEPKPKWFVDSVNGSDSNDGKSIYTPLKTISALLGKTINSGDAIGLKAGSYWRDQLDISGKSNITIVGYGIGAMPILDSDDIAGSIWSLSSGKTYCYQTNWSHNITANTSRIVALEDGNMLSRVTSQALVESTDGSYYSPNDGNLSTNNPTLIYIHPTGGGNPNSNGKTYTITRRLSGILGGSTASNTIVKNVNTKNNANNDGSISLGDNNTISNCIIERGIKHHAVVGPGTYSDILTKYVDQETTAETSNIALTFYSTVGTGKSATFDNCHIIGNDNLYSSNGFYSHCSSGELSSLSISHSSVRKHNGSSFSGSVSSFSVSDSYSKKTTTASNYAEIVGDSATVIASRVVSNGIGAGFVKPITTNHSSTSITLRDCVAFSGQTVGRIGIDGRNNTGSTYDVQNCIFFLPSGFTTTYFIDIGGTGNTLRARFNIFIGANYRIFNSVNTNTNDIDYNIYYRPSGNYEWNINGTYYNGPKVAIS